MLCFRKLKNCISNHIFSANKKTHQIDEFLTQYNFCNDFFAQIFVEHFYDFINTIT